MKGAITTDQKVPALVDVCAALSDGETERTGAILASRYPFKSNALRLFRLLDE